MSVEAFPNELLQNILKRVPLPKLLPLRILSRRWLDIIETECQQITELKLFTCYHRCFTSYNEALKKPIKKDPTSLQRDTRPNYPFCRPHYQHIWIPKFKEMDMEIMYHRFDKEFADYFGQLFPNLESLVLDFTKLLDNRWEPVPYFLSKFAKLNTLSLCGPYYARVDSFNMASIGEDDLLEQYEQPIREGENPFYYTRITNFFTSNLVTGLTSLRLSNIGYLDSINLLKLLCTFPELQVLWLGFACDYALTTESFYTLTSLKKLEEFRIEAPQENNFIWNLAREPKWTVPVDLELIRKSAISSMRRLYWYNYRYPGVGYSGREFLEWIRRWFPNLELLFVKGMDGRCRDSIKVEMSYGSWSEFPFKCRLVNDSVVYDPYGFEERDDNLTVF